MSTCMGHKPSKSLGRTASSVSGRTGESVTAGDSSDECDGPRPPVSQTRRSKKKDKMHLFRKQSEKCKKRQDHQQYLAQESPEPVYDISNCELEEVPSLVFPQCRILQKEVLLLHDNWLGSLHIGNLADMMSIRVLDLHNNEIKSLPDNIGELVNLQVLNVENNKLHKLPDSIGGLRCLQTLNLKVNRLKELPESMCSMSCLRMLDVSENRVTRLPKRLCKVRTLETLALDAHNMVYPTNDICSSGTEEIMKFLCSECGLEYLPPSNFLLDVLDPPKPSVSSPTSKTFKLEEDLDKSIEGYSSMMDKKRLERIELERRFAEHQEEQAALALVAQANREQMVNIIAAQENVLDKELDKLAHEKEATRQKLIEDLRAVEKGADDLVEKLLDMNAKAKKTEELLDEIEKERIKEDKLFEVRWEEVQNLRKREILDAMESILQESEWFETVRQNFTDDKGSALQRALVDDHMMASAQIESVLDHNDKNMDRLLSDLAKQEQLQKEAFEALMLQKDVKHQRISSQIALIEGELASLTVVEIERRNFRTEEELNRLAEKRITLIELLSQLMFEQDCRQSELRKRLEEMEQQRQDGQTDYWLVQYQRLMDQKPQSLIDQEQRLEIAVVKILERSHAHDYMPVFARHRITIETLVQMTEDDLKQMGIHEVGVRKDIMRNLGDHKAEQEAMAAKLAPPKDEGFKQLATAPPIEDISPTGQVSVTARGLNSECSICLDNTSAVIFLNCGHVCCCVGCSGTVEHCPLCRSPIVRRIKIVSS